MGIAERTKFKTPKAWVDSVARNGQPMGFAGQSAGVAEAENRLP
jgi:hypothetical protein